MDDTSDSYKILEGIAWANCYSDEMKQRIVDFFDLITVEMTENTIKMEREQREFLVMAEAIVVENSPNLFSKALIPEVMPYINDLVEANPGEEFKLILADAKLLANCFEEVMELFCNSDQEKSDLFGNVILAIGSEHAHLSELQKTQVTNFFNKVKDQIKFKLFRAGHSD